MTIKYNHRAVRRLRQLRGYSVQELADRAKLTRMAVQYIDRGMVTPRADTIAKLASALGAGIEEFFDEAA